MRRYRVRVWLIGHERDSPYTKDGPTSFWAPSLNEALEGIANEGRARGWGE